MKYSNYLFGSPESPQSEHTIKNDAYHLKHAFGSFAINYV
jgi:hypothetical protein